MITKRVYLAAPSIEDAEHFLIEVHDSQDLHYPWVEAPKTLEQYQTYLHSIDNLKKFSFFIKHAMNDKIVGVVNISEVVRGCFQSGYLGFYAMKKYSGQGFMSEGLQLIVDHAFFNLKLHRLEANIQPDNHNSKFLVKSKKFRYEGPGLSSD